MKGKKIKKVDSPAGFYEDIIKILTQARNKAYAAVNVAWLRRTGMWAGGSWKKSRKENIRLITARTCLGIYLRKLTKDFGKGFILPILWNMRKFYLSSQFADALCNELRWSHYRLLLRIENENAQELLSC